MHKYRGTNKMFLRVDCRGQLGHRVKSNSLALAAKSIVDFPYFRLTLPSILMKIQERGPVFFGLYRIFILCFLGLSYDICLIRNIFLVLFFSRVAKEGTLICLRTLWFRALCKQYWLNHLAFCHLGKIPSLFLSFFYPMITALLYLSWETENHFLLKHSRSVKSASSQVSTEIRNI